MDRYGHTRRKTFFAEGAEGTVPYWGRMRPYVEKDMAKIRAALSNVGVNNLDDYRRKAVIELNSPHTSQVVSTTHGMKEK